MGQIIKPLLIIAAGGTGGHIFPAQALADSILDEGWRVKFFTDSRGVKFSNEFHPKIDLVKISSSTFFGICIYAPSLENELLSKLNDSFVSTNLL